VGTLGGCVAGSSSRCTPQWQFSTADQRSASQMYEVNAKRQSWGGVLPAGYPYVLQTSSDPGSYNGTFVGPQEQISGIGCGFASPFPLTAPAFLRWGIRQAGNTPFLVFSQTDFQGLPTGKTNFPPDSLIKTLFQPLDPGHNPDKGGLGLDEYAFMTANWPTTPLPGTKTPIMKPWRGCGS